MTTNTLSLSAQIKQFAGISETLTFFEIDHEQSFIIEFGFAVEEQFQSNVRRAKPEDWFEYRRAIKNAYCKIQRGRLDKSTRSACRGCTTCERR